MPGAGSPRPRILFAPTTSARCGSGLEREPYRSLFVDLHRRTTIYDGAHEVGDPAIVAHRDLAPVAKNLAFEYALDRTVVDGAVVALPRRRARAVRRRAGPPALLHLYDTGGRASPVGGWDRDINTSEEIVDMRPRSTRSWERATRWVSTSR